MHANAFPLHRPNAEKKEPEKRDTGLGTALHTAGPGPVSHWNDLKLLLGTL